MNGAVPEGSRKSLNPMLGGRASPRVDGAVAAYLEIAEKAGLDPAQMAVAWTLTRPFPCLPIIGATTLAQLRTILPAADLRLPEDVLKAIAAAHRAHPMPY